MLGIIKRKKLVIFIGMSGFAVAYYFFSQPILKLLNSITLGIYHHPISIILFRWSILILIFLLWPQIVRRIGQVYHFTEDKILYWVGERNKIIGWLILFELLICENLVIKLCSLL